MATIKGMLGQVAPGATSDTALYTVPASKNATVKVIVTNRSGATSFRVWVRVNAEATADKQYMAYEQAIAGNDSESTVSFMVGGGDIVMVRAASANVSFSCTGIEQDD